MRRVSVVSRQARRRWAVVAAGVTSVVLLPALLPDLLPALLPHSVATSADTSAAELVRRALASASVPHAGLARSRGDLGIPQLPRLEDVAARLGSVTTARVWWADPSAWRVDVLSSTGERDSYGDAAGLTQWDYEDYRLTDVAVGDVRLRLPRADDLLPPQVGRRLLAGIGPGDRVERLPDRRRIAGVAVDGVRVVPGDARTSIGHLDVWLHAGNGLPVAVTVVDVRGAPALDTRFLELDLARPAADLLAPPAAQGADRGRRSEPDLLRRVEEGRRRRLPAHLAGLAATEPLAPGLRTFGSGLVRLTVVPISAALADQSLAAVRRGGGRPADVPGGEALLAAQGVVALGVVRATDGARAYLLAGTVVPAVVLTAARELLAQPRGAPSPAAPSSATPAPAAPSPATPAPASPSRSTS